MFMHLGTDCHCIPPYPDCFGCLVFEPTEGNITDVEVDIGTTIVWTSVEDDTCSYDIQNWSNGFNCHLWGPEFGVGCGTLLTSGSGDARYHSISPEYFSGVNTLQKSPTGSCAWRKRRVKLLQQIWHHSHFKLGSYPGAFLANICSEAEDTVTYPYTDPVDANDMWSSFVYPKPATSTATGLPAIDARCGSKIDPVFAAEASTERNTWQCRDYGIEMTLELNISKLKVFSGSGGYACRNGQTVNAPTDGVPYWELLLSIPRAATFINCTTVIHGSAGFVGSKGGNATPYFQNYPSGDRRDTAVDLAACPPYSKSTDGTWCRYNTLLGDKALGGVVLRWTKLVDCDNDFLGDPIELTLDAPRRTVDSGDGDCECMDYDINAVKLGITGFNTTATVNPIYV